MSLSLLFFAPRVRAFFSDDSLALRISYLLDKLIPDLNPFPEKKGEYEGRKDIVGFVSVLYILIAALAATFSLRGALEDPSVFFVWTLYSIFLAIGIGYAALIGVRGKPELVNTEPIAIMVGMMGFAILMAFQILVQYFILFLSGLDTGLFFSAINAQLALLAPVSETLFFTLGLYGTLRRAAPELNWFFSNVFVSMTFSLFHYFVYGVDPFTMIILFIGNSIFDYTYEVTQNLAAPLTAHLLTNMMPFLADVIFFIIAFWWLFVFAVIITLVTFVVGGSRK